MGNTYSPSGTRAHRSGRKYGDTEGYRARQGDIVWITLDPQSGHEQRGRRPALVVSNNTFNDILKTAALLCPITNTDNHMPMHVRLDGTTRTTGFVMCEQAKFLDVISRNAEFIERVPEAVLSEAVDILYGIFEIE